MVIRGSYWIDENEYLVWQCVQIVIQIESVNLSYEKKV